MPARPKRRATSIVESVERRLLMAAVSVEVDPAARLSGALVLGEWNSTIMDNWTVANAASSTVADGALTITSSVGSSTPINLDRRNLVSGPDLNFGYFDYLQLRIKLPTGFDRDLRFSFGTSTNAAFATTREFEIKAADLVADDQFHTYRADLGLVIYWRDALKDLRLQPFAQTSTNGETVSIDYIEVGDVPGDTLAFNTNINYAAGVTAATMQKIESKHFAVLWDPAVNPDGITFNTATHGLRALRMLEESWQVFTKVLGFKEPSRNINTGTGTRYKLNLSTWYSGYWAGGWNGYAHMNIGTSGLLDEGWGNPTPHELAHSFDMAQGGALAGGHWESHANYMREARTNWFYPFFAVEDRSAVELSPLVWSNYQQDDPKLIYADFRVYMALKDYGAAFGLNADVASQLWITAPKDKTVYDKLAQIMPAGTNMKDLVGYAMRYWPMLDLANKDLVRAKLWTNATERAEYEYRTGSMLIPSPDKPNWYMVPLDRAPEKYGYMFHELTPNAGSSSVTVEFRGMDVLGTGEDWRWTLAAVGPGDAIRYSDIFAPGTQTFNLLAGETRVLLIAVATPTNTNLDLDSKANTKPTDKDSLRLRYPYEVRVEGATPLTKPLAWTAATLLTHPNGGGKYASTAVVASTAYLGPNARVLGTARVEANARIEDYAVIAGNARVRGSARVSGYSVVYGSAIVEGNAKIRDHAQVADSAYVAGNAIVQDYARMAEQSDAIGDAIVRGNSYPFGTGVLSGTAIADYDYSMFFNISDGVVQDHVPWGDYYNDYFYQTQAKPRGLIASYRVDETESELLWDEFGTLHAVLRGSPTRFTETSFNSRVLQLNGSTQYALLDRSLADLKTASYGLWVNPTSSGQSAFYFGSNATTFMKLVARDANGFAHLTISVNGVVQELVSTQAVPLNAWTHLAVTFSTTGVTMYVNGASAGSSTTMSFRPENVLLANDFKTAEPLYLGRGADGDFFAGKIEDFRVYNVAMTAAEVANEYARAGANIGRFFRTAPTDFNGTSTMVKSGVRNGQVRTLSAWIRPETNDAVSYYEPIFDSNDEMDAGRMGTGVGLSGGQIKIRHQTGFWSTGINVTLNKWTHIQVTFSGSLVQLYVNGVLRTTRSYSSTAASNAGKNYRIGWGQSGTDVATRTFFDGQIFDAQIQDRVVGPLFNPGQPIANDDLETAGADGGAFTIDVLSNDSHAGVVNNGLTIQSVTQPASGTVMIVNGTSLTFTPAAGMAGLQTFTYTVSDGFGGTDTATVQVKLLTTVAQSQYVYAASPNQLVFAFAHDVGQATYGLSDLSILLAGGGTVTPTGYVYDPATKTATFTLPLALVDGNYQATLAAGGALASAHTLDFFVLLGDVNRDRIVNFDDLLVVAQHYGQSQVVYADGDVNNDGIVNFDDLLAIAQQYGASVANVSPARPADVSRSRVRSVVR